MNLKQIYQPKTEAEVQKYLMDRVSLFAIVARINGGTLRNGKHFAYSLKCPLPLAEHKGLPDLLVILPNSTIVFIECKGDNEQLSPEQFNFRGLCQQMKILHFVSRPQTVFNDVKIISDMVGIGRSHNVY